MNGLTVITGGQLFTPSGTLEPLDLLISGDSIESTGSPGSFSSAKDAKQIDARDCIVTPGFIDLHVHLREPGQEWKETIASGAKAAIAGGFTSICCMPNTQPVNDSAETTKFIVAKAAEARLAKVFPIGAVSLRSESKELAPLGEMKDAGCVGFSDDGRPVANAGLMRRALEWARMLEVPILGHEEEITLSGKGVMNESARSYRLGLQGWPKVAEEIFIGRDIELARVTGGHVHFLHVTTARGVELIRRAKQDGISVTAEACPHHLLLTEEAIEGEASDQPYNTLAKMNPPLREDQDCQALLAGLQDGTIDAVATDHAPHDLDTKRTEFDNASFGIIGLQSALPLMLGLVREKKLKLERLLTALTSGPAAILRKSNLGTLQRGKTADITVIDMKAEWEYGEPSIFSLSRNTPWIGKKFAGQARHVFVSGRHVMNNLVIGDCE